MVEGARLESGQAGIPGFVGSNPTLTASFHQPAALFPTFRNAQSGSGKSFPAGAHFASPPFLFPFLPDLPYFPKQPF